jgi:hypothetical protein
MDIDGRREKHYFYLLKGCLDNMCVIKKVSKHGKEMLVKAPL